MDPELANLNLDPPRQPSALRRGLVPALLVNAAFFVALGLGVQWNRDGPADTQAARDATTDTRTMGAAPADTRAMGGAPATTAAAAPSEPATVPPTQAAPAAQAATTVVAPPAKQPTTAPVPVVPTGASRQAPARVQAPAPAGRRSEARPATPEPRVARENTRPVVARSDVRPSFDCAKARSRSERLICRDEELAALDRDTGRLHARAKAAARDQAAFRRQNDAEWKQREATCRDKACLVAWYSHRRAQLRQIVARGR